jgi:REP element-mobilizing transposase RayT
MRAAAPAVPPYLASHARGGPGGVALPTIKPVRKHLPHDVPHWIDPTLEAFFITINCQPRRQNHLAHPEIWSSLIQSIEFREQRGDWVWKIALAMPDHLHGIVVFPEHFHMRKQISDWKRWMATQHGIPWQDGFFDHRLRTIESATEKGDYIRMNPVRAELVGAAEAWPYCRDWKTG